MPRKGPHHLPHPTILVVRVFDACRVLDEMTLLIEDGAKAAGASLWALPDEEVVECLRAAHHCEQIAAVLKLRLVRQAAARGIPAERRHRSTASWLSNELLLDPRPARELSRQAEALTAHPALEDAMLDGGLDLRQATAIADAVDAIPDLLADLGPDAQTSRSGAEIADEAESALLTMARQFPAYLLRRLGERVLAHVAPEIADRADELYLKRQEARARRARSFTLSLPHDGQVRLSGVLGVEAAAIVSAALEPLCKPTPGDDRTPGQRRADALTDVCRLALRTTDLPDHGGEPAQLTVTVPFDPVAAQLGAGTLDNGNRVSATTARRLACDARILPVVLGGAGQVLDAGRTRRLATGAVRRALVARDRGCAFPGCDRPARWCDAHHVHPWSAGGRTSLDNLVLLCRHHHTVLHDETAGWRVRLGRDNLPDFIPPPWTDPLQRPRRNAFHPRI